MDITALQNISKNIRDYAMPVKTPFVIGSTTRYGIKTVLSQNIRYSDYGYSSGYTFSILANISDFTTVPLDDTEVTIASVAYRILSTEQDAAGIMVTLHLGEAIP